jgi:NitT/TauT family transport system ATP-binding protein
MRIGWVVSPGHMPPVIEALGKGEPTMVKHLGRATSCSRCASTAIRKMDTAAQIVIDRVSHVNRPPRGRPVTALDNVSLEVRNREFAALLGPSGCGKSTLLYLVGGFLPVEQGAIFVEGKPIAGPGPDRGIVFQHFALFPWKTVMQNVLYRLEKQGMAREERLRRARAFIDLVGR